MHWNLQLTVECRVTPEFHAVDQIEHLPELVDTQIAKITPIAPMLRESGVFLPGVIVPDNDEPFQDLLGLTGRACGLGSRRPKRPRQGYLPGPSCTSGVVGAGRATDQPPRPSTYWSPY